MAEFFFDFGLFTAKTVIVMALVGALIAFIVAMVSRPTGSNSDHLEITRVNDRLEREERSLLGALKDEATLHFEEKEKRSSEKKERKAKKKALKTASKNKGTASVPDLADNKKRRVFVLEFDGDLQASAGAHLSRELTAILSLASAEDEVVVKLESGGGMVHAYGLASSQLSRVRERGIHLTVCVDKVAASGGYMMACVADKIIAAPFAVLGSIGVVAQLPNFHRLLKKNDIDFELLTAGKHKRTLTMLGENTEDGREKFKEDLQETHDLFKQFVQENRPSVDIEKVATGEVWLGRRALEEKLVDLLQTSDAYIAEACKEADVLEVKFVVKKSIQDKLMHSLEMSVERVATRLWQRANTNFF